MLPDAVIIVCINRLCQVLLMVMVWAPFAGAQHDFFYDRIMHSGTNDLFLNQDTFLMNQAKHLRGDIGLSGNAVLTNTNADQYVEDYFSCRVSLGLKVWGDGSVKSNRKQAQIIENQRIINKLNTDYYTSDYRYGEYYQTIIYLFNSLKIPLLQTLISKAESLINEYRASYNKKQLVFNDLSETESYHSSYVHMLAALESFNSMCHTDLDSLQIQSYLEDIDCIYEVDFGMLSKAIDSSLNTDSIFTLQKKNIELKYDLKMSPDFHLNAGYDLIREIPNFRIGFSGKIKPSYKDLEESEINLLASQLSMEHINRTKEVSVIQYEYNYKLRSLVSLSESRRACKEQIRIQKIKDNTRLNAPSAEVIDLEIQLLQIEIEIFENKQQAALLLLKLKQILGDIELKPLLRTIDLQLSDNKYVGRRYVLSDRTKLSEEIISILDANEIQLVNSDELIDINGIIYVDPSLFSSRDKLEEWIMNRVEDKDDPAILISDIQSFLELERRTIRLLSTSSISN